MWWCPVAVTALLLVVVLVDGMTPQSSHELDIGHVGYLPLVQDRQLICVWGMLCCAVRRAGGDGCARGVVRAVCGALGLICKMVVIVFDSAPLGRL